MNGAAPAENEDVGRGGGGDVTAPALVVAVAVALLLDGVARNDGTNGFAFGLVPAFDAMQNQPNNINIPFLLLKFRNYRQKRKHIYEQDD